MTTTPTLSPEEQERLRTLEVLHLHGFGLTPAQAEERRALIRRYYGRTD